MSAFHRRVLSLLSKGRTLLILLYRLEEARNLKWILPSWLMILIIWSRLLENGRWVQWLLLCIEQLLVTRHSLIQRLLYRVLVEDSLSHWWLLRLHLLLLLSQSSHLLPVIVGVHVCIVPREFVDLVHLHLAQLVNVPAVNYPWVWVVLYQLLRSNLVPYMHVGQVGSLEFQEVVVVLHSLLENRLFLSLQLLFPLGEPADLHLHLNKVLRLLVHVPLQIVPQLLVFMGFLLLFTSILVLLHHILESLNESLLLRSAFIILMVQDLVQISPLQILHLTPSLLFLHSSTSSVPPVILDHLPESLKDGLGLSNVVLDVLKAGEGLLVDPPVHAFNWKQTLDVPGVLLVITGILIIIGEPLRRRNLLSLGMGISED